EARQAGAEVLTGGRQVDVRGQPADAGLFLEPTVVRVEGLSRARELRCVREETFFPLLPVVVPEAVADGELLAEMVEFLNANEYGLRNSVWASDETVISSFAERVTNAGMLRINDSHIGFDPVLATHGGTGMTGGPYGELHYPILRTSHLQGIAIGPSRAAAAPRGDDQAPQELPLLL
ncbi:MAG: aldehyde dehydrogenase family protein, partial [Actinomycetota bacterium]|nr:aldehyde dehydrogenase family protein [Actinomycetota bacterium]